MVDELSGGKMMYAFLRVKDPNTQLFKNVLVNWVSSFKKERRRGESECSNDHLWLNFLYVHFLL